MNDAITAYAGKRDAQRSAICAKLAVWLAEAGTNIRDSVGWRNEHLEKRRCFAPGAESPACCRTGGSPFV